MRSPRLFLAFAFALALVAIGPLVWTLFANPPPGADAIAADRLSIQGRFMAERIAREAAAGASVHSLMDLEPFLPDGIDLSDAGVSVSLEAIADPALMRALGRPLAFLASPVASIGDGFGDSSETAEQARHALLERLAARIDGVFRPTISDGATIAPTGAIYSALISGPSGRAQAILTLSRPAVTTAADWRIVLATGAGAAALVMAAIAFGFIPVDASARLMWDLSRAFDAPGGERAMRLAEPAEGDATAVAQARRALRQTVLADAAFDMLEAYLDRKGHPKQALPTGADGESSS